VNVTDRPGALAELPALESATPWLDDPARLREFADTNGYLFCRGLLPRADMIALRAAILDVARRHQLLADEDDRHSTRTRPGVPIFEQDTPQWLAFYRDILCLRALNALPAHRQLYDIVSTLVGEPVFHHARVNVRFFANFPFQFASPPHRDFTWVGGTADVWTSWIPLVDIDRQLGGLQVLPGSHRRDYHARGGAGENDGIEIPPDEQWHTAPHYELGDVVLFHSRTVHSGGGNLLQDRLRVSAECRFQPISHPVRADVMEPHWKNLGLVTWDELYHDWPADDPLRYYWRELPLTFVTESEGSHQQNLRKRYLYNVLRLKATGPS
jgi:ectoine hydroxylase-related dioxygenase (phytanoyl-CoA dioxygenase family)